MSTRNTISIVDPSVAQAARRRIDALTKPPGSLGRIEELAVRLCAIEGGVPAHRYERRAILVGAGDHGVSVEGVSAYPPEVTAQMVAGFCAGFAAINTFARMARAEVFVADFGVDADLAPHPALIDVKVGRGTANLARGPAMTRSEAERALAAGFRAFEFIAERVEPLRLLALGDMGIANTTPAAALIAAFSGSPAAAVVGRGTGIDDERLARKIAVVESAVKRAARREGDDPLRVASELGGFEIVGLAGVLLAAAQARVVILIDGLIVSAAAVLAQALSAHVVDYCVASHRSREPGHTIALHVLGLEPLLDLDLRLGEASGAALAIPLVEAAARMVSEMKTFEEAGVSVKEEAPKAAVTTA